MISQLVLKYLRKATRNGYFWGSANFYFYPEENQLHLSKSVWRKFLPPFNFSVHTSYATLLLGKLLHAKYFSTDETDEGSKLLLEMAGLILLIPPFCCQLCFFRREESFAAFVNQYLTYYRNTTEGAGHETLEKMFKYVARFFIFLRNAVILLAILIATLKPNTPIFLSSLSHSTQPPTWQARAVSSVTIAYVATTWWSTVLFAIIWVLGYIFSTVLAIRSLRSKTTALSTVQFAGRYRCLQLLEGKANEIVKFPLATAKALCLLVTIRCMCGVVKSNDGFLRMLNLNYGIGLIVFLGVTFKALGQMNDSSEEVLYRKRKQLDEKWFRRFHRSCPPLKIEVAGMYFVDLPVTLTMGSFVIENVANLLILSK